eukprot:12521084-Alexandrium_andersonii.AAC.1
MASVRVACALGAGACLSSSVSHSEAIGPEVAPGCAVAGPARGLWRGLVQRVPSNCFGDGRAHARPASE